MLTIQYQIFGAIVRKHKAKNASQHKSLETTRFSSKICSIRYQLNFALIILFATT